MIAVKGELVVNAAPQEKLRGSTRLMYRLGYIAFEELPACTAKSGRIFATGTNDVAKWSSQAAAMRVERAHAVAGPVDRSIRTKSPNS